MSFPLTTKTRPEAAHRLFEGRVGAQPDSIAARFCGETLTYAQLNHRANRLAHHLTELGARPDSIVGIFMDRGIEMLVSLLAIQKAGAAYLPLDPFFPEERLKFMVEDSGAEIIITRSRPVDRIVSSSVKIVDLETSAGEIDSGPCEDPHSGAAPDCVAYVLYTSGSTGRPKGVQVENHSLTNVLTSLQDWPGFKETDTLLAISTLSFDIAAVEMFLPLICGGTVEIAPRDVVLDGRLLGAALERTGATVMQATPATWRMLLDAGWEGKKDLRIFCGGEAMTRDLAGRLLARSSELWNLYGPTETAIYSIGCRVERGDGPIPIGHPVANTQVYILDDQGKPVDDGEIGELYIGGEGVARGYLNRPELTAERFIEPSRLSTLNPQPSTMLYRTGDLVSIAPSGLIHYHGRTDHQVKIRGFRIELTEIETVLAQHPAVRQAVVTAREDRPGEKTLVAYIVSQNGARANPLELRAHLLERLPDYMAPGHFVTVESFPLTPNGKIDRNALPAPTVVDVSQAENMPRDAVEAQIALIWEEALGIKNAPLDVGFFDLGGNSLIAARMFALIEQRMGRNLPLATILEAPTIEALAEVMQRDGWSPSWRPLVAIRAGGDRPPFYVVHGAGSNIIFHHILGRHLDSEIPLYGLQARGLDGKQEPLQTIEEMAALYVDEIRTVQPNGPYYLAGFSMGGIVAFEMAQMLTERGETVAFLGLLDTNYPVTPAHFRERRNLFKRRIYPAIERWERSFDELRKQGAGRFIRLRAAAVSQRFFARGKVRTNAIDNDIPDRRAGLPPHLQRMWRANMRAMEQYRPKSYPGKVTLFWGASSPGIASDRRLGWSDVAQDGLEVHVVPGTHQTMRMDPFVSILAEKLNACLDRAHRASSQSAARSTPQLHLK